jgi:hypothetical protein
VDPTDEAAEVRWIEPATVGDLMIPAFAVRVSDAHPAIRAHHGYRLIDA